MAEQKNMKIRRELAVNFVRFWQLAKIMGISEMTLTRRLREELPENEQERICSMIRDFSMKGEQHGTE